MCPGLSNGLSLAHPRALEIALATRQAMDRHLLEAPPRNSSGLRLLRDWVDQQRSMGPVRFSHAAVVHVLLVDTDEVGELQFRPGLVTLEAIPQQQADLVLATTAPALAALLTSRVPMAQATERKLVV